MDGLDEDFEIPGGQNEVTQNITDFEGAPNSLHKFCLLCKYGSLAGHETDRNVNPKIKLLEKIIETERCQVCRAKVKFSIILTCFFVCTSSHHPFH